MKKSPARFQKSHESSSSNDIHLDLEMRSGCSFQGGFKTTPYKNPMVIHLWVGYITMQIYAVASPQKQTANAPEK